MSTLTTDQRIVLAQSTDLNDFVTAEAALLGSSTAGASGTSGVESRLVKRYLSAADRTARNPTPAEGELSVLADTNLVQAYTGTVWSWPYPLGEVKQHTRGTDSGTTTTEVGVMRIDNIPVYGGRAYKIWTSPLNLISNTGGDLIEGRLRYDATGLAATTASTQLAAVGAIQGAIINQRVPFIARYAPAADATLSILLSVGRFAGSGTVRMSASGTYPLQLIIEDIGLATVDSGTDI